MACFAFRAETSFVLFPTLFNEDFVAFIGRSWCGGTLAKLKAGSQTAVMGSDICLVMLYADIA